MKKGGLGGVFFPKNSTKIGDKKKHPWFWTKGGDKNRRRPTLPHFTAVPSALWGLTSLFGMGRGVHPRNSHREAFTVQRLLYVFDKNWEGKAKGMKN